VTVTVASPPVSAELMPVSTSVAVTTAVPGPTEIGNAPPAGRADDALVAGRPEHAPREELGVSVGNARDGLERGPRPRDDLDGARGDLEREGGFGIGLHARERRHAELARPADAQHVGAEPRRERQRARPRRALSERLRAREAHGGQTSSGAASSPAERRPSTRLTSNVCSPAAASVNDPRPRDRAARARTP
jgi:hypothetical protein